MLAHPRVFHVTETWCEHDIAWGSWGQPRHSARVAIEIQVRLQHNWQTKLSARVWVVGVRGGGFRRVLPPRRRGFSLWAFRRIPAVRQLCTTAPCCCLHAAACGAGVDILHYIERLRAARGDASRGEERVGRMLWLPRLRTSRPRLQTMPLAQFVTGFVFESKAMTQTWG